MPSPISRRHLVEWFEAACVPREQFQVGVEWEKEAVRRDGRRVGFDDADGIESILVRLADRFGWTPVHEGGRVIALSREGDNITLEPGGQIEISTAPHQRLAGIERALRRHLAELQAVTRGTDVLFGASGFTPVASVTEIPFVPKARYGVMRDYLAVRGALGHSMMKGTSSVQVTLDYESEADCARKFAIAMALSPVVTALAACSPFVEGRRSGYASWRSRCWQQTDPDRTGLLGDLLARDFTFTGWVDWLMDVPMMFLHIRGRYISAQGRTFGDWIRDGISGTRPSVEDWELHLTSVFPEVRVKNFIEIRGADNSPLPHALGLVALWKGLLYDPEALGQAEEVAALLPLSDREALWEVAARDALAGRHRGRSLRAWAGLLLEIASGGLQRQAPDGPAEVAYLAPLVELAKTGESRAEQVSRLIEEPADPRALVAALAYPAVVRIPPVAPSAGLWSASELRDASR
ncbi:MAG: glutamate--cysteine ligase [Proteobacteria bacterium]|nr:glutamate--cysteine ligase [Pseudomonadota bacterium]